MGYTNLSRAHTFDQVNTDQLAREIVVRELRCEIPGCVYPAEGMFFSAVPALACKLHLEMWKAFSRNLEASLVVYLKGHMAIAQNAAYEDDGEVVISFSAEADDILADAKRALTTLDRFVSAPSSRMVRREPEPPSVRIAPVRPPIGTLGDGNISPIIFDPFS